MNTGVWVERMSRIMAQLRENWRIWLVPQHVCFSRITTPLLLRVPLGCREVLGLWYEKSWGEYLYPSIMDLGLIWFPAYRTTMLLKLFTCKICVVVSRGAEGSTGTLFLDKKVFWRNMYPRHSYHYTLYTHSHSSFPVFKCFIFGLLLSVLSAVHLMVFSGNATCYFLG